MIGTSQASPRQSSSPDRFRGPTRASGRCFFIGSGPAGAAVHRGGGRSARAEIPESPFLSASSSFPSEAVGGRSVTTSARRAADRLAAEVLSATTCTIGVCRARPLPALGGFAAGSAGDAWLKHRRRRVATGKLRAFQGGQGHRHEEFIQLCRGRHRGPGGSGTRAQTPVDVHRRC